MNVIERRQEIAILRAVGWRRGRIAAMVVAEATLLLLIGTLLAIPLSLGLMRLLARVDSLGIMPESLGLSTAAGGFVSAILIGLLLSMIPLSQVLRIQPAAALRAL
jgi:putative ABC transport system permease protein